MKYDLSNNLEKKQSIIRFKSLLEKKKVITLSEEKKRRTIPQNSYLHVLFSLWGSEYGYTISESKKKIKEACPFGTYEKKGDIFYVETSKMNTTELTEFIEWFRNYSSKNGLYLPTSGEYLIHKHQIDKEINKSKIFL